MELLEICFCGGKYNKNVPCDLCGAAWDFECVFFKISDDRNFCLAYAARYRAELARAKEMMGV